MRFMVIVKATPESEKPGAVPDPKGIEEMNKHIDELMAAGVLVGYDGLHPSSKGARVKFSGSNRIITDGPFAETKELIAGFMILRVNSLEEAIGWVKRMPFCGGDEGEVEIRQVFEPEDFASNFNEEEIEQERQIRAQLAEQATRK
ncbi:DGPFAETKE domain protein [Candidatus Koribacter versatilis Ellin345]|uniref:DGPFAETKE domain protein n=1 Tax=Koribacter versatilis (strain Ellin345) TaxID=204669 RepID=Q1INX8_KORVE|nr:YciI family protein [Candidatus Koribacter versatilis]ABF41422.1 DGPFAETKE domain protein [Candidatus Koribacter versatilis Ellin345]